MKKLISLVIVCVFFIGCAGPVTGIEYNPKDVVVVMYKVVKKGVTTFMTKDQIESKKLDKVADSVEYAYSILKDGTRVKEKGLSVPGE